MIFVARLGGGSPVMITARWFDAAFVQHGEEFADPDVVEWRHPSRNNIAISDPLAPCFHPRVSARDDVGLDNMHAGQSPSLYGRRENQRTVADAPYRFVRINEVAHDVEGCISVNDVARPLDVAAEPFLHLVNDGLQRLFDGSGNRYLISFFEHAEPAVIEVTRASPICGYHENTRHITLPRVHGYSHSELLSTPLSLRQLFLRASSSRFNVDRASFQPFQPFNRFAQFKPTKASSTE